MITGSISANERKLLTSFLFFALAWPIFGTFMNTFLWRGSHDPILLAIFNIGIYIGLPLGFRINAKLLQTVRPNILFFVGCVLQGIAPLLLTLFSPSSPIVITALGCMFGVTLGLYWGSRNLATLRATEGRRRVTFLSLESVQNTLTGVFMPLIIGFSIASATNNIHLAYILLVIIGLVLLSVAGILVLRITDQQVPYCATEFCPIRVTPTWNHLRIFEMLNGAIASNESIISLLMILAFFGLEDAVGATKSTIAIFTAVIMFLLGKRLQKKQYPVVITIAAILLIGSAGIFATSPNSTSVMIFFGCIALITGLRAVTEMSVVYGTIDHEVQANNSDRFHLLLDREIYLNIGRIGVLVAFIVVYSINPQTMLQYGLLATSLLHIPLIFVTKRVIKNTIS